MRRRPLALSLLALLLSVAFLSSEGRAEDVAHPKGPHLRYMPSYGDAMLEARTRNVPVLFSRHKDF